MLTQIITELRRLSRDPKAATAIEYAMVAFFIGIVLLIAMESIGTSVSTFFAEAGNGL